MKISLRSRNGWGWCDSANIHLCGYAYIDNKFYNTSNLVVYFANAKSVDDIIKILRLIDGCFALVVELEGGIFLATDHVRSIPLFWFESEGEFTVLDTSCAFSATTSLNKETAREFLALGYVTGNETLMNGVCQLGAGEYVYLKDGASAKTERYYEYIYNSVNRDIDAWMSEIDKTYSNMIDRLINALGGRTAVLPLSGGHDSRLLVYYLSKKGYKNIVTYTYGREGNPERLISKKVSEFLNLRWIFVPYKTDELKELYTDKELYAKMADYCGNMFTVPLIQEWRAIQYLTENRLIPEDSIIVPGYSNDLLAGSHTLSGRLNYEEVIDKVISGHFVQWKWRTKTDNSYELFHKLLNELPEFHDERLEPNEAYEVFDIRERQAKHINNAVRIFEFYNYKWLLPFWQKDLIRLWMSVPDELRYERKLFYLFTNWKYPELMKTVPVYENKMGAIKKKIASNRLLLKLAYSIKFFYSALKGRRHDPLNYYGYVPTDEYWQAIFKYKTTSYYFMFSLHYLRYLERTLALRCNNECDKGERTK